MSVYEVVVGKGLDQTLAVLNGFLGDYLARTRNGLATEIGYYKNGQPLPLKRDSFVGARPKLVILVHGLMSTEGVWHLPDGSDYGSLLERELPYAALYVRYNTGLAIADNGAGLAALLSKLLECYPVALEELVLIGHSMGGLVIRSACHTGGLEGHAWLPHVRRVFYVGTPHLGAPAERLGKLTTTVLRAIRDPYTELIADIGDLRSSGIRDLGHADLRHEDRTLERSVWNLRDVRHPLPLLPEIAHYLVAGSLFTDPRLALVFGDALVSVASAHYTPDGVLPADRLHLVPGIGHVALAHHPAVYAWIRNHLEQNAWPISNAGADSSP